MTANQIIQYKLENGDDMSLTPKRVKELLVNGEKDKVTERDVVNFMMICKAHRLNPFLREAYLIKYGNNPATMVVGKEVFTKRAQKNPKFKGFEAGLTLLTEDGRLVRRDGSMKLQNETIVGGWCRVYIEGYENPMFDEVSMSEYSTGQSNWKTKPATMIRKTAIVHALREAFPDDLGGLYDASEMGVDDSRLPDDMIEVEPIDNEEASAATEAVGDSAGAGLATRKAVCTFCGHEIRDVAADATLEDLDAAGHETPDGGPCEHPHFEWAKRSDG